MTVIVGSSNTDSTGGAGNLTAENGTIYDIYALDLVYDEDGRYGTRSINQDGMYIYEETGWGSGTFIYDNLLAWNQSGKKEFYMNQESFSHHNEITSLSISNFVDVYLDFSETTDYQTRYPYRISIEDAKRGYLDLSGLNDRTDLYNPYTEGTELYIHVKSNGSSWDNTFDITMGNGLDRVILSGADDSKWTEFNIELNAGNDYFYYGLASPYDDNEQRYVNGGTGHDNIFFRSGQDLSDLKFENFESILSSNSEFGNTSSLTLNKSILDTNGVSELLVAKFGMINFSDEYDAISISDLTNQQEALLKSQYAETGSYTPFLWDYFYNINDFYAVTISYENEEYTILTDADQASWV